MSEVYNPESQLFEQLAVLGVEARRLAQKRDQARSPEERRAIQRQLDEVETQIAALKKRLRPQ